MDGCSAAKLIGIRVWYVRRLKAEEYDVWISRVNNCMKDGSIHKDREENYDIKIKKKGGNKMNFGEV